MQSKENTIVKRSVLLLVGFMVFSLAAIILNGAEAKTIKKPAVISTKDITEYDAALKTGLPVVVKLGADWCPPCRMMKPIIAELKNEQNGRIVFLDLDIEKNEKLAKKFRVTLMPTIVFINRSGKAVGKDSSRPATPAMDVGGGPPRLRDGRTGGIPVARRSRGLGRIRLREGGLRRLGAE